MYKQLKRKIIQYYCDAHSEVLEAARERIASGQGATVCYSLRCVAVGVKSKLVGWHVRHMIRASLGRHDCVIDWLSYNHPIAALGVDRKAYRLAWIDWMLEGWQNKRDNA